MQIKFYTQSIRTIKRKWLHLQMRRRSNQISNKFFVNYSSMQGGRDEFYQALIQQELTYWFCYPETFSILYFEWIVNRRGFNIREQHFMILSLYSMGFDTTPLELVDLESYRANLARKDSVTKTKKLVPFIQ